MGNKIGILQYKVAINHFVSWDVRSVSESCISRNLGKGGVKFLEKKMKNLPFRCRNELRSILKVEKKVLFWMMKIVLYLVRQRLPEILDFIYETRIWPHQKSDLSKFEPKILVWVAISKAAVSQFPIDRVRQPTVDVNTYLKKCLPKLQCLLKCLQCTVLRNYSSYYARKWQSEYCRKTSILYQKTRSIEDSWGQLNPVQR